MEITSVQNPKVKQVVRLQQNARERRELNVFVVEGVREFSLAQRAGYKLISVFICFNIYTADSNYPIELAENELEKQFEVSREVYSKMAYRDGVEGIIGVFESQLIGLSQLPETANPLILVLEKVEKPGNLGAIFRTADAAGVNAVIICDAACEPFNPNAIRSSVGCVFSVPWAICSGNDAISWLRQNKISIFSSTPAGKSEYFGVDFTAPSAIVMGAEDSGLSLQWLKAADKTLLIPMQGSIDSLNVSVSAAVLLFEAVRQRKLL